MISVSPRVLVYEILSRQEYRRIAVSDARKLAVLLSSNLKCAYNINRILYNSIFTHQTKNCSSKATCKAKVENTTYLDNERHGERCETSVHVTIRLFGHGVDLLRESCQPARLCWLTSQVLQFEDLSKYAWHDLVESVTKNRTVRSYCRLYIPGQTNLETKGYKLLVNKILNPVTMLTHPLRSSPRTSATVPGCRP